MQGFNFESSIESKGEDFKQNFEENARIFYYPRLFLFEFVLGRGGVGLLLYLIILYSRLEKLDTDTRRFN
jgi:hypothetical protein